MPNDKLLQAIIQAESSGNPEAVSPVGATGLMQIMQPALTEYNQYKNAEWTMHDMLNPKKNVRVGTWYFNERIPQMLRHFGVEDTPENRLWAYNAGIGRVVEGIKPKETVDYIQRVLSQQ